MVMIDPGHGGDNTGALGICGIHEKNITLPIAQHLAKILRYTGRVKPWLTRNDDRDLNLDERAVLAHRMNASALVSIHANTAENEHAQGVEIYFLSLDANQRKREVRAAKDQSTTLQKILDANTINSQHRASQQLGFLMHTALKPWIRTTNTGLRQESMALLKKTNVPAVLVEIGFLSNPTECVALQKAIRQHEIAQAMAVGILRFIAAHVPMPP